MSRRRFKLAENPNYHKVFDTDKYYSIKNSELNSPSMERSRLSDRAGCESLQREILEKVRERSKNLKNIEVEFATYKDKCAREGRTVPAEMPRGLFDKWLESAAKLDVALEELDLCEERLKAISDGEQKASDEAVLQYGPVGIGKLCAGILSVIDGQSVAMSDDGILRIMHPNSPYHGMSISDYKQFVVAPYKNARTQQHKKRMDDLLQQHRKHPELALPEHPPALRISRINKANLPPWPDCVPRLDAKK
jgi:hypothetical protein